MFTPLFVDKITFPQLSCVISCTKKLNLIIETKNKTEVDLSVAESERIKSAENLYESDFYNVKFVKQMSNQKMSDIIKELVNN